MLKIKEIFRLKYLSNLSNRKIARILCISHSVVNEYIREFKNSGYRYEDIDSLDDKEILLLLKKSSGVKQGKYPMPDFAKVHIELRNKIVTLTLLHEEYIQSCPNNKGYGLTWFCNKYKEYAKKLNPSMHLTHKAGEKIFVDFSGVGVDIVNPKDGTISKAQIFVAVLPASGYAFVKAVPSQKKRDFIEAHCEMFEYFKGASKLLVPDNLKSAVTKADRYDPKINIDYLSLSRHYGSAVMPARAYRPKDKAKVEHSVKLVQRWILARVRNFVFYSIEELNKEINRLMPAYHNKIIKRVGKSRKELYEELDKPALIPLPETRYEYKEFKLLKVNKDYHIQLEYNYYSVPYQLIGKKVEVWFGAKVVTISYEGKIVATHPKLNHKGEYSTKSEHMASSHRKYLEWSPGKIMNWGLTIGTETAKLFKNIMDNRPHPEMGFRTCLGIIRSYKEYLDKGYSEEHLEVISSLAITRHCFKVQEVKNLLKRYKPSENEEKASLFVLGSHENIRGSKYYK
jgi:transposase